jgi:hypothetical protein
VTTPIDNSANQKFWNNLAQIGQQGSSLPPATPQFTYPKPKNITVPIATLANGQPGYGGTGIPAAGASGTDSLSRFLAAIRGQESGGVYNGSPNPDSGALGAYQMLPSNVAAWSKAALGRTVSNSEFLNSPSEQDAIARYELGQYLSKYGLQGAAAAWYGGEGAVPNWQKSTNPQGQYPSIYNYVQQVMQRYNGG